MIVPGDLVAHIPNTKGILVKPRQLEVVGLEIVGLHCVAAEDLKCYRKDC